jgi:thiamine transport system ATP-binding protein
MLEVRDVTVRFGERAVVDRVSLAVHVGETVGLLGPSGCGKSTLLRAIAGLEPPESGTVAWEGRDLATVPTHRREFALMFQDYALFPHRDVSANVAFGLRMAGIREPERGLRVREVLELVGLTGFERRRVAGLSGGEQQRVALARALAPSPRLLMLDEPLGSLDRVLRERLVGELRELLDASGLPALYVTHDHDEAFALADRIALMRAGAIVQTGAPAEVWAHPVDAEAAEFLGFTNTSAGDAQGLVVTTAWGTLRLPEPATGPVTVVLRPDALSIEAHAELRAKVTTVLFAGERAVVHALTPGGGRLELRVNAAELPAVGDEVGIAVAPGGVLVYPRPAGGRPD